MAGWSLRNTVEGRTFWTAHKSQTVPLGKGVGERRHAQSAGPRVQCGGSRLRVERRLGERRLLGDRGSVNGATSMARTSSVKRRNTGPGIAPRLEVPQLLAGQTLALRGGEMHGAGRGGSWRALQDSNLWPSAPEAENPTRNTRFYNALRRLLTFGANFLHRLPPASSLPTVRPQPRGAPQDGPSPSASPPAHTQEYSVPSSACQSGRGHP